MTAVGLVGGGAHTPGHGALQIGMHGAVFFADDVPARLRLPSGSPDSRLEQVGFGDALGDRKSTRLNSSHLVISYAVFCLKKKKTQDVRRRRESGGVDR